MLTVTHCKDYCSTTANDVATGIKHGDRRLHVFAHDDNTLTTCFKPFYRSWNDGVGWNTDGYNYEVHIQCFDTTLNGHGRATTWSIGFAKFHALQYNLLYSTLFICNVFNGVMKREEFYTFLLCVVHFFKACGHFFFRTTIDNHSTLCAKTERRTNRVHRRVTTTDNGYALTKENGCISLLVRSVHQVYACEIFVTWHHACAVFSLDSHEVRKTCTRCHEDTFVTFCLEFGNRDSLTNHTVLHELHTTLFEVLNFELNDSVGEAEFGNTVLQHTTNFMKRFKHCNIVTASNHAACKRKTCRTWTNHSHLLALLFSRDDGLCQVVFTFIVGSKAFEVTNCNRLTTCLNMDTLAFTLLFLRTHTTTYCGQSTRLLNHTRSTSKVAHFNMLNECRNVNAYGATFYATGVRAVKATLCFLLRLSDAQTFVYFFLQLTRTVFRIKLGHYATLNLHTFLWLHLCAEFSTPSVVATFYISVCFWTIDTFGASAIVLLFSLTLIVLCGRGGLHRFNLFLLESRHTLEHFVKVYLVTVKFRTVNAHKLCLTAYSDTTSTTHTSTVNHNRVERYICGNFILLREQADELHHDSRTDSKTLVHLLTLNNTFDTLSHQTLLAIRTVVRHNDNLITVLAHFFFKNNEFLWATSKHRNHTVASLLQSNDNGQHGRNTYTTSGTHYGAEVVNMSSLSQRTDYVQNLVTDIQLAEFGGCLTYGLNHQGNRTLCGIRVCYSEGDALTLFTQTDNYKMSRTARTSNQGRFNFQLEDLFRKLLFANNLTHIL